MTTTESAVTSSNEFGFKILRVCRMDNPHDNLIYSPASIVICLGILYEGAKQDTKREIEEVLGIGDQHSIHKGLQAHLKSLRDLSDHNVLDITNMLAIDGRYKILPEYLENININYNIKIKHHPKEPYVEECWKEINQSIENISNGKIAELFNPDSISPDMKLVLANVIYFTGVRNDQFFNSYLKKRLFYTMNKRKVVVDMVFRKGRYKYLHREDLNVRMLETQYLGGKISLIILLPLERYGLPLVEKILSIERLNNALLDMRVHDEIMLAFPNLVLEENLSLKQCLMNIGITSAFTSDADFSRISEHKNLFITSIFHKAFLDVNVQNMEMETDTAIETVLRPHEHPSPPIYFTVNHPFIIIFRELTTGLIVFIGSIQTLGT